MCFFFFKQKTAYDMRISDWSSDVCSSDLRAVRNPLRDGGSPVSVGVGGSTGSYGSGLGLGIGINLSGKPKAIVITELNVQIKRRADATVIWEGRAITEAKENAPAAQPGLAAAQLAGALFKDFPGVSGRTITVKKGRATCREKV